ncbi:hypothetical protein [Nocardioides convexus]|uniref:hypothetical protein n=1 Tax=Nocardioides convexus TaxID=2712224 RepID=UPI00241852E2|nr:hypothetical protein [Nocardioides convexus]
MLRTGGPALKAHLLRQEPGHRRLARAPGRGRQPRGLPRQGRPLPRPVAAGQPAA